MSNCLEFTIMSCSGILRISKRQSMITTCFTEVNTRDSHFIRISAAMKKAVTKSLGGEIKEFRAANIKSL